MQCRAASGPSMPASTGTISGSPVLVEQRETWVFQHATHLLTYILQCLAGQVEISKINFSYWGFDQSLNFAPKITL